MPNKAVAYYRVSTRGQEVSGLGLEAQKCDVGAYCEKEGLAVAGEYVEVEKGKKCDRVEIQRAIGHAKRMQARLVVAKLDRLARNVLFTAELMQSGVDFVCCDNPHANRFTIHIYAAMAEEEARLISERTKAALARYKARGGVIGGRRLTDEDRAKGRVVARKVLRRQALEAYEDLRGWVESVAPWFGPTDIAKMLNMQGHTTRKGRKWTSWAVVRMCDMYKIPLPRKRVVRGRRAW